MRFLMFLFLAFVAALSGFAAQDDVIRANDLLRVEVEGNGQLSRAYRVGSDGSILMNVIGSVRVGGLSEDAAARAIADALRAKQVVAEPRVTVERISDAIYVSGAVANPGSFDFAEGLTLERVLDQARPTPEADLSAVRITQVGASPITVNYTLYTRDRNVEGNPALQPGDQVFVVRRIQAEGVLVLGAVRSPQAVAYEEGLTLAAAITKAGGALPNADVSQVKVTRRTGGRPEIVDLQAVNANVPVGPGDQVFVPQQTGKVYVLVRGAVQRPGLIPFTEGMTLRELMEIVTPTDEAQLGRIVIERQTENNGLRRTNVNFVEVLRGAQEDTVLRAGDVVEVPFPPRRMTTPETLQIASLVIGILLLLLRR